MPSKHRIKFLYSDIFDVFDASDTYLRKRKTDHKTLKETGGDIYGAQIC